jgi:ketosteroid isomerase-like protein
MPHPADAHAPDPLAADRQFFAALLAASAAALGELLADDFLLVDVMSGSEVPRQALLDLVGSGQLRFGTIDAAETRVRRYGTTAIVTGRTRMSGHFGQTPFSVASRYTHVFVEQSGRWHLATAQGTAIAPA